MAEVAPTGAERSLDDFFAKRDKKKRKEKCKGRESVSATGSMGLRKDKKEKEKVTKNESQDAQVEKVCRSRCSKCGGFLANFTRCHGFC